MSNLPPGCSIRDIPGNRPEDDAEEALYDTIYTMLTKHGLDADRYAMLAEDIYGLICHAYGDGFQDCTNTHAEAKEIAESERLARSYFKEQGEF